MCKKINYIKFLLTKVNDSFRNIKSRVWLPQGEF